MDYPWVIDRLSIDYPWIKHGLSIDYPWIIQRLLIYPWIIQRLSMDYPWIIHSLSMDYSETIHGLSRDYPWIIHGLSSEYPCIHYSSVAAQDLEEDLLKSKSMALTCFNLQCRISQASSGMPWTWFFYPLDMLRSHFPLGLSNFCQMLLQIAQKCHIEKFDLRLRSFENPFDKNAW